MINEYDGVLPFATWLNPVVSILQIKKEDINADGTLDPEKRARFAHDKVGRFASDDMLTKVKVTYSREEYDRGSIEVLPNPLVLPERGTILTFTDESAQKKRYDDKKRARHESTIITEPIQSAKSVPVQAAVKPSPSDHTKVASADASGVAEVDKENITPAEETKIGLKEKEGVKAKQISAKHALQKLRRAHHYEIGLEEAQYTQFDNILKAGPSTNTRKSRWAVSDDLEGEDDGCLGGF